MPSTMRKTSMLVLALVTTLTGVAFAGAKFGQVTTVNASYAYGNMGYARNAGDATFPSYIGCSVTSSPGYRDMTCFAGNGLGRYGYCYSTDLALIEAARAVGSDSYIYFAWNTSGQCTYVSIENSSTWEPKLP